MKIYTKTGDHGETGLYRGGRTVKDSQIIRAGGAVDELNSVIGWARAHGLPKSVDDNLNRVQNDLFVIGADIATPAESVKPNDRIMRLEVDAEKFMEEAIDLMEKDLPPLENFILPGGVPPAAAMHLARSVCRRAEREAVALSRASGVSEQILIYLNRLSDMLFVMARYLNNTAGADDILWRR